MLRFDRKQQNSVKQNPSIKKTIKIKKKTAKSLCCTPETNIILYVNYNSIKIKYNTN